MRDRAMVYLCGGRRYVYYHFIAIVVFAGISSRDGGVVGERDG